MDIIIRKALPEDAYDYTACHISCWQSAYRGIIPDDYLDNMPSEQEQRTEERRQYLCDPNVNNYCVVLGDKMIGFLGFGKCRDEDKPDSGEIGGIYLLREFWDKGYGGKMMDFAKNTLMHMGFDEIIIWVFEENIRARRFYEKHGFVLDGAKKEMVRGKPLVAVRYACQR